MLDETVNSYLAFLWNVIKKPENITSQQINSKDQISTSQNKSITWLSNDNISAMSMMCIQDAHHERDMFL